LQTIIRGCVSNPVLRSGVKIMILRVQKAGPSRSSEPSTRGVAV
jgi:hypothetical protein